MIKFSDYAEKYETIKLERRDGVLQITLHTNGDTVQWNRTIHDELPECFYMVGADAENKAVILTGAGKAFSGKHVRTEADGFYEYRPTPEFVERLLWEGNQLLVNLMNIGVPVIAAVNGPVTRHAELPLLCDIVICADHAFFVDSAHFPGGQVPGDGVHIAFPMLMGLNRGRYFLLTGEEIQAAEAKQMGLVNEVLPADKVLPRAWELATKIARKPNLLVRGTKLVISEYIKRQIQDLLPYALYVEGFALMEKPERPAQGAGKK